MSSLAFKHDMLADRGAPFDETFAKLGEDWTGATIFMQIKPTPDYGGAALVNLAIGGGITLSYAGTDTIANHISAGRLPASIVGMPKDDVGGKYAASDSIAMSKIAIHVSGTNMSGPTPIPFPFERGDDWVGAYDLRINRAGGLVISAEKLMYGDFIVRGTVTS